MYFKATYFQIPRLHITLLGPSRLALFESNTGKWYHYKLLVVETFKAHLCYFYKLMRKFEDALELDHSEPAS